jgi:hypothetical protein
MNNEQQQMVHPLSPFGGRGAWQFKRRDAEAQRKNLSPDPSPQGRGALPKEKILLFRTMVSAAEAELPLSCGEGVGGRGFPLRLRVSAFKKSAFFKSLNS